jgi:hypothetical protein
MEGVVKELPPRSKAPYGGIDRQNAYEKLKVTAVSGGGFFPFKELLQEADPRRSAQSHSSFQRTKKGEGNGSIPSAR